MKLNLHTAKVADWEKEGGPHNIWQKIASKSYGALTPANLASIAGGIIAVYGLFLIANEEVLSGLLLVAIGRIADLVDGLIAEYTKTKSPLGELVDVTMDKIVLALALIVFVSISLIPWPIIAVVALQNIANVVISLAAKLKKKVIHPSSYGKLATALSWVAIILYPLGDWIRQNTSEGAGTLLVWTALASFGIYLVIGFKASLSYMKTLYKIAAK